MLKILGALQLDIPKSPGDQDEHTNPGRDFLPVYLRSLRRHNQPRRKKHAVIDINCAGGIGRLTGIRQGSWH